MVGGVLPNYIWQYDVNLKTFEKFIFSFENKEIGISSVVHYGDDMIVSTHISHIAKEPRGIGEMEVHSICSHSKQKCTELAPDAFVVTYAGFKYANNKILVAQYRIDEHNEYALELHMLDDEMTLLQTKFLEPGDFTENYAEQIFFNNHTYFISGKMRHTYAYKVDENLNVEKMNVRLEEGIGADVFLAQDNIINIKDNEYLAVAISDGGQYLVSILIDENQITFKKIGKQFLGGGGLTLSHKSVEDNRIYAFSFTGPDGAWEPQIYIYELSSMEPIKKIPLDAIGEGEEITFIDKI
ncbi:hypothetical protein AwErysi_07220 [Erysipelotrichaceae bacterium]|nr:hypothetical protein AwErysi_07220 [Erysipelotrichaceae bacterium]